MIINVNNVIILINYSGRKECLTQMEAEVRKLEYKIHLLATSLEGLGSICVDCDMTLNEINQFLNVVEGK